MGNSRNCNNASTLSLSLCLSSLCRSLPLSLSLSDCWLTAGKSTDNATTDAGPACCGQALLIRRVWHTCTSCLSTPKGRLGQGQGQGCVCVWVNRAVSQNHRSFVICTSFFYAYFSSSLSASLLHCSFALNAARFVNVIRFDWWICEILG